MDGIVLLAKKPGLTSFSSLNCVKKAFETKKVGHTGTLDSFAQGLLVVCVGRTTRLAGNITEFDKSYKAIIKFGEETDTLEYTGNIIKKSDLPSKDKLLEVITQFEGEQEQIPPSFSAIHIDGRRASDLARKGQIAQIPSRKINVYKAELQNVEMDNDKVSYCEIHFSVSKGTYIRALIRDISAACGSCGHLIGLYRTKVGNFSIENAAGFSLLKDFSILNCKQTVEEWKNEQIEKQKFVEKNTDKIFKKTFVPNPEDELVKKELKDKIVCVNEDVAGQCGFNIAHLTTKEVSDKFKNGKPILKAWFNEVIDSFDSEKLIAVFDNNKIFTGLIEKQDCKHLNYKFVIN